MYFCISFRTLFPKRKSTGKNAFTLLPVPDERDFFQRIFPFITSFDFFRRIFYDIFSSFPKPLSKEEEAECLRLMAEGDEEAKNKLIEHNLRLVAHVAKKYSS